jgi:hypothetical protein
MENGYTESFNGSFRDECLNEHWFRHLGHAKELIADWRDDYNQARPHSSLNYLTPNEFAQRIGDQRTKHNTPARRCLRRTLNGRAAIILLNTHFNPINDERLYSRLD